MMDERLLLPVMFWVVVVNISYSLRAALDTHKVNAWMSSHWVISLSNIN